MSTPALIAASVFGLLVLALAARAIYVTRPAVIADALCTGQQGTREIFVVLGARAFEVALTYRGVPAERQLLVAQLSLGKREIPEDPAFHIARAAATEALTSVARTTTAGALVNDATVAHAALDTALAARGLERVNFRVRHDAAITDAHGALARYGLRRCYLDETSGVRRSCNALRFVLDAGHPTPRWYVHAPTKNLGDRVLRSDEAIQDDTLSLGCFFDGPPGVVRSRTFAQMVAGADVPKTP